MPPLLGILGAGSFDDTPGARWFAHLLTANCRLGREFAVTWAEMQCEIGEPAPGTTLASPASEAGRHSQYIQAALTRARERHAFQELD
eukprot:5648640-Karenia_brevis.AAC.1